MKPSAQQHSKPAPGAGFLMEALTGMVAGVLVFIFTENIAIAIPVLVGLGLPLGMALEERRQGKKEERNPRTSRWMVLLLGMELLCFILLLLVVKFS